MKRLLAILFLASPLAAQVVVTPAVSSYPMPVLSGSTRQLVTNITVGGTQCASPANNCTINWSCVGAGGASCTFSDQTHTAVSTISGGLPVVTLNIGGAGATCSITGTIGSYVFASTSTVVVTAQSTDNTLISGTFNLNVCSNQSATMANGDASVRVLPFYDEMYPGAKEDIQSFVAGCVDETGTWAITSQPGGGDGTLSDTTYRDTVFTATVTGRYTIQYTANCNSGTQISTIYVVSGSAPSYAATPNMTKPVPCVADPANTGPVYDIGAGHTYATISATPTFTTVTAGTTYLLYNTDTTGLAPSTYAEYFVIANKGTRTNPINFCGVPDSLGNLPIMTGTNAVGQSTMNPTNGTVGYGLLSLWPGSSHYNYWQSGSVGPQYVRIAGISFQNANPNNTYTQPGGVSATCPSGLPASSGTTCAWLSFTAGVNARSGTDVEVTGNETNGTTLGIFTDNNGNNAWATYTQNFMVDGNNFHNCGWTTTGAHCLYFQTLYGVAQGNRIGPGGTGYYLSGDGPSGLKVRGSEVIARYNLVGANLDRDFDLVENQDGPEYISMDLYLAAPGDTTCSDSFWCDGDTAGAGVIAAYFESEQKDFIYGNIAGWSDGGQVHYGGDQGGVGWQNRDGVLYFYDNTMWQAQSVFDNTYALGYLGTRFDSRNNIFWPYSGGQVPALTRYVDVQISAITNLFETSSISITTPITGGVGGTLGWANGGSSPYCSNQAAACLWPLTNPMNTHLPGLGSTNYLFTGTQPFNSTYFTIPSGSAAIGAATALTGLPAQLPVRFEYNVLTNSLISRSLTDTTIGAYGYLAPTLTSITLSPSTVTVATGYVTQQFTPTCHYSDGSTDNCTASGVTLTWTSSVTGVATVNSSGLATTALTAGSTTIEAANGAINGTATLTAKNYPTSSYQGVTFKGVQVH